MLFLFWCRQQVPWRRCRKMTRSHPGWLSLIILGTTSVVRWFG